MNSMENVITRLEKVADKLESISSLGSKQDSDVDTGKMIEEFESIISGPLVEFLAISKKLGGDVLEAGKLVENEFKANLEVLKVVAVTAKPPMAEMVKIFKPLCDSMDALKNLGKKSTKKEVKNHFDALIAFSDAFTWVQAPAKPQLAIKEHIESGQFYTNRVIKETSPDHKEWVKKLTITFNALKDYTEQNHGMGLAWKIGGATSTKACDSKSQAQAKPVVIKPSAGTASPAALFSELSKGTAITSKLKKVDDSEKTHKNPNLRKTAVVPETKSEKTKPKPVHGAATTIKPPIMTLDGKKWSIENQQDQTLTIPDGESNQIIYMYNCQKTILILDKKMNVITIDKCVDCGIQAKEGLVSSFEVINCKKIKIYANGIVPSVIVNSSNGVSVIVNDISINTQVTTNTSTEVNVGYEDKAGNFTEYPVPEVLTSHLKDKKLVTVVRDDL